MSTANGLRTVLIVNDDQDLRETLHTVLDDHGYRVSVAVNGAEALIALESSAELPGVILLDLMMPVMDGWQMLERMSGDASLADIPVVVMSGSRVSASPLEGMDVLSLPIQLAALLEVVEKHCGRPAAGA